MCLLFRFKKFKFIRKFGTLQKALGETLRPRISMESLHIEESSERKDSNLIRNMSLKIDSLRQNIKQITEIINEY